jgi:hypothetical protein
MKITRNNTAITVYLSLLIVYQALERAVNYDFTTNQGVANRGQVPMLLAVI